MDNAETRHNSLEGLESGASRSVPITLYGRQAPVSNQYNNKYNNKSATNTATNKQP